MSGQKGTEGHSSIARALRSGGWPRAMAMDTDTFSVWLRGVLAGHPTAIKFLSRVEANVHYSSQAVVDGVG